MITVGYGYVIPITPIKKIIFIIIILIGLGLVVLSVAMLVEIFEEELRTIR
jgi:voltage-gated potassium channel Kch